MATSIESTEGRTNYLKWEEYFMGIAVLASKRSKDPVTQVGACLVSPDNQIIGVGYNSHPKVKPGDENDKIFPWSSEQKHKYVCYAVMNTILHSSSSVKGSTIYVTHYPSNECAKLIVQSGVKEVVYLSTKNMHSYVLDVSRKILKPTVTEKKFSDKVAQPRKDILLSLEEVEFMESDERCKLCDRPFF
jgi:dCMP deaminase